MLHCSKHSNKGYSMADTDIKTAAPKAEEPSKADAPAPAVEKAAESPAKAEAASAPAVVAKAVPAATAAPAAPAKTRGRKARTAAAPARPRGRPRKAAAPTSSKAAPARRGRKPAAELTNVIAAAAPARRGRKAAAKATVRVARAAQASVAQAAIKTSASVNKTVIEGTKTMKNEANKVADRVQAVFGDANERAKSAFERNARFAEELTEFTKGNVEALVASTKVAAKGVENLGQEVAELSRKSFEEASAALRGFSEIKSPTDFFRLQTEFARGQFDTLVAESAKMSEAMIKLAGDVAQPITNRYTVAAERVKNAVAI
jgi:phasin family protein